MKEPWLFLGTLPAPVSSSVDGRHRVMGSEQEVMCEHPHAATVEERLCRRPRVGGQAADAEKEFGLEQGEDHVAELVHGHGLNNWPKIARMFRDQGNRVQTGSQQQSASLNPQDLKKRGESYKQGMQN